MYCAAHNQIACQNLKNLRLQACSAFKDPLEERDENMTEWRGYECTIDGHLGNARCEIMTGFVLIVGDP
jgi:hypothetical protein